MLSSKKSTELDNKLLLSDPSLDRMGTAYKKNLKDQIESINICFVSSISKKNKLPSLNFSLKDYSKFFSREKILDHIANYYFEILSNNARSRNETSEKFDSTILYPNPHHDFYRHLDQIISKNISEIFFGIKRDDFQDKNIEELSLGNPFLQNFSNHNPIVQNLILNAIKNNFDLNDEVVLQVRDKLLMAKHLEPRTIFSRGFQNHIQTPQTPQAPKAKNYSSLFQDRISGESTNFPGVKNSPFRSISISPIQNQNPITSSQISSIVIRAKNLTLLSKSTMTQDREDLISKDTVIGRKIDNKPLTLGSRISGESIFQATIGFQSPFSSPETYKTNPILPSHNSSPFSSPSGIRAETLHGPIRTSTPLIP